MHRLEKYFDKNHEKLEKSFFLFFNNLFHFTLKEEILLIREIKFPQKKYRFCSSQKSKTREKKKKKKSLEKESHHFIKKPSTVKREKSIDVTNIATIFDVI